MKLSSLSLNVKAKRVAAAVLLVGTASSAQAGIMTPFLNNGWSTAAAEDCVACPSFGPGGGGQPFDAEYLFYKQVGPTLWLGLQSGFNVSAGVQDVNGGNDLTKQQYYAGDLALSFDNNPSTWEYGVDFGLKTKDYYGNLVDAGTGTGQDTAGLYSVTTWNNNILFPTSNPFAIDAGSLISGVSFTNTSGQPEGSGNSKSYYRIVSFNLTSLGLVNVPAMHWTMSCGNDAITSVPEPGSLTLVGAGLLGLVALRLRRSAVKPA